MLPCKLSQLLPLGKREISNRRHRTLISFVFLIGSLRTNIPFVLIFFCLIFLFSFLAAAQFYLPTATTAAEQAYVKLLVKIAGGWGLASALLGW